MSEDLTTVTAPEGNAAVWILERKAESLAKERGGWLRDLEEAEATFNGARDMINQIDAQAVEIKAAIALIKATKP
jgi:hypothetical protein